MVASKMLDTYYLKKKDFPFVRRGVPWMARVHLVWHGGGGGRVGGEGGVETGTDGRMGRSGSFFLSI